MAEDCALFRFVLWGVVGTIICCFGFVGNMLSLVTFQRDKRSPTSTLLQCLASSDLLLLLSVFVTDALPYICDHTGTCDNPWRTWPYIRYVWILTPISHMCSIWFVVLIAVNRYFAVCHPHRVLAVWDNVKTPLYVTGVLVLVISFNLPRFFEYKIVEVVEPPNNMTVLRERRTDFGHTSGYRTIYKVMLVNVLLVMLPIAALIVITTLILIGLHLQRRRMEARRNPSMKGSESKGHVKSRATSEITFVLVVVVIVAILCQSSLAAFHFVRYTQDYECGDIVFYLDNVSKLLVNVNSCVNFVIYCVASPKFRTLLLTVVTCECAEKIAPNKITVGSRKESSKRNGSQSTPKNMTESDV